MALNARLWGVVQRRPGSFLDAQDKVRGAFYSVGHNGQSAQTPSLPLPLPYLSPYQGVGGLIQLVIFQDSMWTTLSRGEALEVSRASHPNVPTRPAPHRRRSHLMPCQGPVPQRQLG